MIFHLQFFAIFFSWDQCEAKGNHHRNGNQSDNQPARESATMMVLLRAVVDAAMTASLNVVAMPTFSVAHFRLLCRRHSATPVSAIAAAVPTFRPTALQMCKKHHQAIVGFPPEFVARLAVSMRTFYVNGM